MDGSLLRLFWANPPTPGEWSREAQASTLPGKVRDVLGLGCGSFCNPTIWGPVNVTDEAKFQMDICWEHTLWLPLKSFYKTHALGLTRDIDSISCGFMASAFCSVFRPTSAVGPPMISATCMEPKIEHVWGVPGPQSM